MRPDKEVREAEPAVLSPRPHILVVEDDDFIRQALGELLEAEGYAVHTAAHGGEGLEALRGAFHFGLILLDLVMPGMSGLDFRRQQLRHVDWAKIPTVVLTGDAAAAHTIEEFEHATLIEKPLKLSTLLQLVQLRLMDVAPAVAGPSLQEASQ